MQFFMAFVLCVSLLLLHIEVAAVAATATGTQVIEIALTDTLGGEVGWAYYANISVGTPGQVQSALVDTGSSDTIFPDSTATACRTKGGCATTFVIEESPDYKVVIPGGLSVGYTDHSKMEGDYSLDRVQIGMSNESLQIYRETNKICRRYLDHKRSHWGCKGGGGSHWYKNCNPGPRLP